ncbi:hypothetical protein [Lujinxingia sediminis]|uniref:hypothetical protein n=1 Tax=Lujinxingia sediminis TaxID=2480984 RepID=UPI0013E2AC41|nr:hypothetical protein [Lujinxingia sediminis]
MGHSAEGAARAWGALPVTRGGRFGPHIFAGRAFGDREALGAAIGQILAWAAVEDIFFTDISIFFVAPGVDIGRAGGPGRAPLAAARTEEERY